MEKKLILGIFGNFLALEIKKSSVTLRYTYLNFCPKIHSYSREFHPTNHPMIEFFDPKLDLQKSQFQIF